MDHDIDLIAGRTQGIDDECLVGLVSVRKVRPEKAKPVFFCGATQFSRMLYGAPAALKTRTQPHLQGLEDFTEPIRHRCLPDDVAPELLPG